MSASTTHCRVATEAAWLPPLQLRGTRLTLLAKRLPRAPTRLGLLQTPPE